MSDPVVAAAERAQESLGAVARSLRENTLMRAAAREALKRAREDLQRVDGVLSQLHYRGIVDTEQNRESIKGALEIVQRYTR